MTKGQSQFARLSELREKQETQEVGGETQAASKKKSEVLKPEKPVPVLAQSLPDLELPDLPEPATQQQAVTRLLSAQVPQERKLAFDQRVLEARRYYPDLEMREGVIALLSMLDDERIYRMWLHEIGKLKG